VRIDAAIITDDAATTNNGVSPGTATFGRRWRLGALYVLGLAMVAGAGMSIASAGRAAIAPAAMTAVTTARVDKAAAPAHKAVAPMSKKDWVIPMHGQVTSCPGPRWGTTHQGIDIGNVGAKGGTTIVAAASGTVLQAGYNNGGYGNMVIITHAGGKHTLYGHASKVFVKAGQSVRAGQKIALEGSTGHSTGPHLHFEVQTSVWHRINPVTFMESKGVDVKC
jgi:murein DD-endopeptidase MepM/ murein hydrolase activator NlpD